MSRRPRPSLKDRLTSAALGLGFDQIGITTPDRVADGGAMLAAQIAKGHHGSMTWLADTLERRRHPSALWPETRSIVAVAMNYGPDVDPLAALALTSQATISVYAARRDYHEVMKGRLKTLADVLKRHAKARSKVFVDTAPLLEKPIAAAAGIGWQGKHTVLISREAGNWLFLGLILTTAELEPDAPASEHCGTCRKCLDICPTNAFPAAGELDARRCIAYLTVEHDGPIAPEFRALIGNRVFGCDDCLAICPWNKFARITSETKFALRDDLVAPPLAELAALDDAAFRTRFANTPVKRAGRDRFLRNVLIAIGNSGDAALVAPAQTLLGDPAAQVRGAAVWALSRLLAKSTFRSLAEQHRATENDGSVIAEWQAALPTDLGPA